jgi:hypothetical protein
VRDPAALGAKKHRPAGDQAGKAGGDLLLARVDAVVDQQRSRPDHRANALAIEHLGIEPADEHRRAHLVADIVGGDPGCPVEGAAARQGRGGDDGTTRAETYRGHIGLAGCGSERSEASRYAVIARADFEIRLAGSGTQALHGERRRARPARR